MLQGTAFLNFLREVRERVRFRRLPTVSCDASALRLVPRSWLRDTFAVALTADEWPDAESEASALNIPVSAGGVNPGDRRALFHLVRALRPERVLEVGTNLGASTAHIALALRANGSGGLSTLDVLAVNEPSDSPWALAGARYSPAEMMRRLGMEQRVHFICRPSLDYLAQCSEKFDLLFLDGDHSAATVYHELPEALRRTAPGGVVLLHDFFPGGRPLWPDGHVIAGPWLAVQRLLSEGARFQVQPLGELPWLTKQGGRWTSLAMVSAVS